MTDKETIVKLLADRKIPSRERECEAGRSELLVENDETQGDVKFGSSGSFSGYTAVFHFSKTGELLAVYAGC